MGDHRRQLRTTTTMKNLQTPPARAKTGHHSRQSDFGAIEIKDKKLHQTRGTQAEGIPTPREVDSVQQPQKMLPPPEPPPAATQTPSTKPSGQRTPPGRAETSPRPEAKITEKNISSDNPEHPCSDATTGTMAATRPSGRKKIRAVEQRQHVAVAELCSPFHRHK